jgi:hypothetical protein
LLPSCKLFAAQLHAVVEGSSWVLRAGSRAYTLAYFGYALPLPLAAHLPLQLLAIAVNALHSEACSLPALDNPLMAGRIRAFHQFTASSLPLAGCSNPQFPLGSPSVQCAAVLNAARLFFGLLLPTYVAARQAAPEWRQQAGRRVAEAGQHSGRGAGAGPAAGSGWGPAAVPSEFNAQLAAWLLENVFVAGAAPELQLIVWTILAALCWMVGFVLALSVEALPS